jgi:hypothetical protein
MKPDAIDIMDQHLEQRGTSVSLVPHRFRCDFRAAQGLLTVDGLGAICAGDRFAHERGPDHHAPKSGSFVAAPTGRGEWTDAGQGLLFVDGRAVVTLAGRLTRCDDVCPEATSRRAVVAGDSDLLYADGARVVLGR